MNRPPPDFPAFPSRPIAGGIGRAYRVHGPTCCAAYWVEDGELLKQFGATDGFYLYAFYEHGHCGPFHVAIRSEKILADMRDYRAAASAQLNGGQPIVERKPPTDCPPPPREPEQIAGYIAPTYNREPAQRIMERDVPTSPPKEFNVRPIHRSRRHDP